MNQSRNLRAGAAGAAIGWLSGIAMTLVTGGQDAQGSQTVEPKDALIALVQNHPDLILKAMGCDTLFVIGYVTVFCALFAIVPRDGRLVAGVGLAAGLVAGLCDAVENVLYVVYALAAQHHTAVQPELPFHYYVSALKWAAAFTSVGLFTLVFPRRTWFEWLITAVMATFPLGGALSTAFPEFAPLRALFFVVGMPLFAVLFLRRAGGLGPQEVVA